MSHPNTQEFFELLSTPSAKRDISWEKEFAKLLPFGRFDLLFEDAKPGPDGWPYLFVKTATQGTETGGQLLDWLATRGIGLAVNPDQAMPDFVLTYGMTWNFKERGAVVTDQPGARPQTTRLEFKQGDQVLVGQPTESFLPNYVRKILKQFFMDQGVIAPKIAIVMNLDRTQTDLAFSIESLGSPTADEHNGIAEAISWFLPAHYSIALFSEKVISGFQPL